MGKKTMSQGCQVNRSRQMAPLRDEAGHPGCWSLGEMCSCQGGDTAWVDTKETRTCSTLGSEGQSSSFEASQRLSPGVS